MIRSMKRLDLLEIDGHVDDAQGMGRDFCTAED